MTSNHLYSGCYSCPIISKKINQKSFFFLIKSGKRKFKHMYSIERKNTECNWTTKLLTNLKDF